MASGIGYRFRVIATVFLCIGWSSDIYGAGPFRPIETDPVEETWRWRQFRELEGEGLSCLTEGPNGSIYFGTDEGVRVYNGLRWGVFRGEDGIVGAPVNALLTAKDGSIYAGTETSLVKYDGSAWSVVFPPSGDLHWRFTDLEQAADGSIWAATNWGALHLDGDGNVLYTTDAIGKAVRRVASYVRHSVVPEEFVPKRSILSRIGLLTAPAGEGGVAENLLVYAVIDDSPAEKAGIKVGDRIATVDGQALVDPNTALVGPPGTVVNLEVTRAGADAPVSFEIVRAVEEETFRPFVVYDVKAAKDGSVWLGLESGEILRFQFLLKGRSATGLWRLFTEADGLQLGELPRIGQSPDGKIWAASYTQQGGLNRYDGVKWHHSRLSTLGGSDLNTSFATTSDGAFWVGGNSLAVLRDGTWHTYPDVEAIPTHRLRLLVASDGSLWVAGLGQFAARMSLGTARWAGYAGIAFQTEGPDGTLWFLSDDDGVVSNDGAAWLRYGAEDGVMSHPSEIYVTRDGTVFVTGSHDGIAATSVMSGDRFELKQHPRLSWNIDDRAILEAQDGSIWMGAKVDFDVSKGQVGGLLQYQDGNWTHHEPPDAPNFAYGIAQTNDGLLWFSGEEVKLYNGSVWLQLQDPPVISRDWTDAIYTTPEGDLWVGTRTHGAFHYDGNRWREHRHSSGLAGSRVYTMVGSRNALWVGTDRGVSLYDGRSWVTQALPDGIADVASSSLHQDGSGTLWISNLGLFRERARGYAPGTVWEVASIGYRPDNRPPDTEITLATNRVSSPGNTVFAWRGFDPFKDTADEDLQFAWRLNGGEWSRFESRQFHLFQNLANGKYTLEVVARDRDLNVDKTPAKFEFVVGK